MDTDGVYLLDSTKTLKKEGSEQAGSTGQGQLYAFSRKSVYGQLSHLGKFSFPCQCVVKVEVAADFLKNY